jgi:hypothetical protein
MLGVDFTKWPSMSCLIIPCVPESSRCQRGLYESSPIMLGCTSVVPHGSDLELEPAGTLLNDPTSQSISLSTAFSAGPPSPTGQSTLLSFHIKALENLPPTNAPLEHGPTLQRTPHAAQLSEGKPVTPPVVPTVSIARVFYCGKKSQRK